jgi:hypothetical protein
MIVCRAWTCGDCDGVVMAARLLCLLTVKQTMKILCTMGVIVVLVALKEKRPKPHATDISLRKLQNQGSGAEKQ